MKSLSVRLSLGLLVLGTLPPIVAMGTFVIWTYYQQEQAQVARDAIGRARAITSAVDREFGSLEAGLRALATSPRLAANDLAGFHAHAAETLSNFDADSIVLLDRSGQMLLSTARPFGTPLPRVPNPVLLERILKTGKPGVSNLFIGPITGKSIYTFGVPIKRDGMIVYTLNATVEPDRLFDVLAEQKLPESWRAVIADGSGSIVARSHGMAKFQGEKVVPDLLQRMRLSHEEAFESKVLEGIPVLISYSRSKATGWTVAIGAPLAELKAGIHRTLAQMLAVALIALAIALALAWFFGGRIASAFSALIQSAKALGTGGTVSVPCLKIREANEVGQALFEAARLLDQASRAKADFLSGMSHELRTPLNAILGFSQLMESSSPPPTPSQKECLDQILDAGWHLLELVNGVLNLALIESGKATQSRESVSLAELMVECRLMVEPHALQSRISLTFPQFEVPCFVHVDRSWVKQCLINLLSNAVKYNKPGGTVVVEYALRNPDVIRIIVRDTGDGLTAQHLAQLFQPFSRLGMAKRMGLSLVVTKQLVELMGGTIGAESEVGVGSTFWFELNLTPAPEVANQEAQSVALIQV